jgi:hypothetical protein
LRPIGDRQLGCFSSEYRNTSSANPNDGPLNFSQSTVLLLSNPQILSGLRGAYDVSGYNMITINLLTSLISLIDNHDMHA